MVFKALGKAQPAESPQVLPDAVCPHYALPRRTAAGADFAGSAWRSTFCREHTTYVNRTCFDCGTHLSRELAGSQNRISPCLMGRALVALRGRSFLSPVPDSVHCFAKTGAADQHAPLLCANRPICASTRPKRALGRL